MHTARDKLNLSLWDAGTEIELDLVFRFKVYPGSRQTLEQPGEEPTAELVDLQILNNGALEHCPKWLFAKLESDDGLNAWLLSEAREADEYAREQKADADREERQLERNNHV